MQQQNKQKIIDRIWKKNKNTTNPEDFTISNAKTEASLNYGGKESQNCWDNFHNLFKINYTKIGKPNKSIKRNLTNELLQLAKSQKMQASQLSTKISFQSSTSSLHKMPQHPKPERRIQKNIHPQVKTLHQRRLKTCEGISYRSGSYDRPRVHQSTYLGIKRDNSAIGLNRAGSIKRQSSEIHLNNRKYQGYGKSEQKLKQIRQQLSEIYNNRRVRESANPPLRLVLRP